MLLYKYIIADATYFHVIFGTFFVLNAATVASTLQYRINEENAIGVLQLAGVSAFFSLFLFVRKG